jgi:predicted nucleic acid-binding protein
VGALQKSKLYKEDRIAPANWVKAVELRQDAGLTDAPHVAVALETGGLLWTGDEKKFTPLRAGNGQAGQRPHR